ncbi:MAG: glycosyltransferase family 4 protein, partial [Planctomycetaceae bacterium]
VGRHYWPHLSSDVASRTVRLADGLSRSGVEVEVLTPRYASTWPDQICHREVLVHRPTAAPRSDWSMGRYLRHVESWLREHAYKYDVLYSATMREEATLVVDAARRANRCSVLHHAGSASEADAGYAMPSRYRRRSFAAWQAADVIVVSRASAHQSLLGMGLAADQIQRVPIGIASGSGLAGRDATTRSRSRQTLADVNGDLATGRDSMVVLSIGSMNAASGMMSLAQAIPPLVDTWPDLRFWMIGDGSLRNELHRHFKFHGVRQSVAMPGTFVDLGDLLSAADLYVQPSLSDGLDDFLPQAIAAPLPLVLADGLDTRAMLSGYHDCAAWCPESDPPSLQEAIRRILVNPSAAQTAAERLRRELVRQTPYSQTIDGFLNLFSRLTGKSVRPPDRSAVETVSISPLS